MTDSNTHARYTAAEHAAQEAREQAETSNRLLEEAEKAAEVAYAALVTEQKENHMTNDNDKASANVADAVQELRNMADRELASDARKAYAEVEEAVAELMAIAEEQKAEIKRLRTELAKVEMDRDILVQYVQRHSQGGR